MTPEPEVSVRTNVNYQAEEIKPLEVTPNSETLNDLMPQLRNSNGTNGAGTDSMLGSSDAYKLRSDSAYTVGAEGAQGTWGVAKAILGPGASNAEIADYNNRLLSLNKWAAKSLQLGDTLVLPTADTQIDSKYVQSVSDNYMQSRASAQAAADAPALTAYMTKLKAVYGSADAIIADSRDVMKYPTSAEDFALVKARVLAAEGAAMPDALAAIPKFVVNEIPRTAMDLVKAGTVLAGALGEANCDLAGVRGSNAFANSLHDAASMPDGNVWAYSNDTQRMMGDTLHSTVGPLVFSGEVNMISRAGVYGFDVLKSSSLFVNDLGREAGAFNLGSLLSSSNMGETANALRVEVRNGYSYTLDDLNRATRIEGDLVSNPLQGRNVQAQLQAGGIDRLATDEGGHFIGRRFDGPLDDFNHFAQDMNFNRGAYKSLENSWQRALDNGSSVYVDISNNYLENSLRPHSLDIRYTIDGVPYQKSFFNRVGGR